MVSDPIASRALVAWSRRRSLYALLCLSLVGCAAMIEEASRGPAPAPAIGPVSLMPMSSVQEGQQSRRLDAGGILRPGAGLATVRLVRPVAVAARDGDLYVADAGAGVLYRVDPLTRTFLVVPGLRTDEGTRLALGVDRVLHVLDRRSRQLSRLDPGGRPLPAPVIDPFDLAQPVDLVVDERFSGLLLADGLYRQVLALPPGAGVYRVLSFKGDADLSLRALDRIAVGPRYVYLADPQCACLYVAPREGPLLGRITLEPSGPVAALAADGEGRLFVASAAAREIQVLVEGRVIQRISYRSLGLLEVADLRVAAQVLWIVDPAGAQVLGRRIMARLEPAAR